MLMYEHVTRIVYTYAYLYMCVCMCMHESVPAFMCARGHMLCVCVHGCLCMAVRLCTVLSKADLALQLPTFFPGS